MSAITLPVRRRASFVRRFATQEAMLALAVVGLAVAVGLYNPRFLSPNNLADLLLGNAYVAVAAVGMSMVIVSGNIDISVGALIGVLATISGSLAVAGYPIVLAWGAPLVVRRRRHGAARRRSRLSRHTRHRRHARHVVDPERRAHQRDRGQVDHGLARQFPPRRHRDRRRRADAGGDDDCRDA